jgi:aminobenzoyl-glutamate utilization protein B
VPNQLLFLLGCVVSSGQVLTHVEKHADRFGSISRQIWETPELGFQENKSSALLQQELQANGFAIRSGVAAMPAAFTASWGTGKPVIVLMGEFDALPGLSQKDLATRQPGTGGRSWPWLFIICWVRVQLSLP